MLYLLIFSSISLFLYFPLKHYTAYKVAKFKKENPNPRADLKEPKPFGVCFDMFSLVWLVGMFTFTIGLAVMRFNEQVSTCSGSRLSKEEKKDQAITDRYDMAIGNFVFVVTLIYTIICGCIVLAGLVFGILYAVKGAEWINKNILGQNEDETAI